MLDTCCMYSLVYHIMDLDKHAMQANNQSSKETDFSVDLTWWGSLRLAPIIVPTWVRRIIMLCTYIYGSTMKCRVYRGCSPLLKQWEDLTMGSSVNFKSRTKFTGSLNTQVGCFVKAQSMLRHDILAKYRVM